MKDPRLMNKSNKETLRLDSNMVFCFYNHHEPKL